MMYKIKFLNEDTDIIADIKFISNNIVQILNTNENLSGFKIFRDSGDILGDYSDYTTLYKKIENGFQLSNDKSVYIEPEIEEVITQELTLEEIKEQKISEFSSLTNQTIENGQDIELISGTDHFTYKQDDQANIKNAFDIANTLILKGQNIEIPFYDSNNVCKKYNPQDIITIYMSMQSYITYMTTLCHQLEAMVKDSNDKEFIQNLTLDLGNLTGKYLETFNEMINQSKEIIQILVS